MTTTLIIGLLIPLLGTMLGSAFVFFMRDEMSVRLQKSLLGFASGVMVAASVWSLLIPAMEMEVNSGKWAVFPAAVGFLLGMGFLLLIDELTHTCISARTSQKVCARICRRRRCLPLLSPSITCQKEWPLVWCLQELITAQRIFHHARSPLHARLCRRRHVLRRGRGAHP